MRLFILMKLNIEIPSGREDLLERYKNGVNSDLLGKDAE